MLTTPSLADRLRVSVGRLARRLRQQSLGGLTPSQTSILATLDRHGALTMSEIANHEGIARPSATGIVGRLVDQGLVDRTPDPEDGRSSIVGITKAGVHMLEERRQERTAYLAHWIDGLDQSDRDVLARAIVLLEGMTEER